MTKTTTRAAIRATQAAGPWEDHTPSPWTSEQYDTFTHGDDHRLAIGYQWNKTRHNWDGTIASITIDGQRLPTSVAVADRRVIAKALLAREPMTVFPYGAWKMTPTSTIPRCPSCHEALIAPWCPFCRWANGVDRAPWQGGV